MEESTALREPREGVGASKAILRACDMCRKKKIRCEPTVDGCAQCTRFKTPCHFTPVVTKKAHRRPAGFKYISELEGRLKRMETLLEDAFARTGPGENQKPQGEDTPFNVLQVEPTIGAEAGSRSTMGPENDDGDDGWDSAHLLPPAATPSGSNGVSSLAAEQVPSPCQTPFSQWQSWMPDLPSAPVFKALPAKRVALELIEITFRSFIDHYPLFDQDDFLEQFEKRYEAASPLDPGWWACVNVVFALAHRFRAMRTMDTERENAEACGYIRNALVVVAELNILQHSLPAIQALVGLAIVLQGTPLPQPASVFIASALRLAQIMGLHRRALDPSLPAAEVEQRKRVFWIAYFVDRDISLRLGQPFAQDDDDMDADLPNRNLSDRHVCPRFHAVNFFHSRIGLAVIQGQIYKRLYSVHGLAQPAAQRAEVARELHGVLAYWKASVAIDIEELPPAPLPHAVTAIAPSGIGLTIDFIHMLIMRFTYVQCLVMIDRHHLPRLTVPDPVEPAVVPELTHAGAVLPLPESLCLLESRRAVRLIQFTPHGNYACVWLLLHPFFAAVSVLLDNVACQPASMQARSDLQLTESVFALLDTLTGHENLSTKSEEAERMLKAGNSLRRRAKMAVELATARAVGAG